MPYEKVIRGFKFAVRLEDLRAEEALDVRCPDCQARYLVAPHHLHDRYQPYMRLILIVAEMACRRCGRRNDLQWHIVRAVCEEEVARRQREAGCAGPAGGGAQE